ncbi:MAG: B12-binding domain-containing radical SAM protein [Candidatus Aminicenantes bacterium]
MKVLLINPSITQKEVYAKYSAGAPSLPPLGLCYIAAVLLARGHPVKILDCAAENISLSQLQKEVQEFKPGLVGVTSTTVSYEAARKAVHAVKEVDHGIKTVLGGAHLSALPQATMAEDENIDIGIFGEGEYSLLEVVDRLERRESLVYVEGTIVRQDGCLKMNKARDPVKNLDEIPFPARHLLKDLRLYSHTPFRGAKFMTTMITSRGCPFQCGFCDQSVFGRVWRYHSPEYVVDEISYLKETYGIDFVSFEDDNFMLSKKRTIEICQRMIKKKINIQWSCLGHANEVDDETLSWMKKAGCRTIYLGIESGSPRILELINKKANLEEIRKGVERIKKHNISTTGSFILGLPTETKQEMESTIDFALNLPLDGITFFIFTPYPNTPLRELALKHGNVSREWKSYSGHPGSLPFIPEGMSEEFLLNIQKEAYRRFLLRPSYLIRHWGTFANRKAVQKGVRFLRALISP